MPIMVKDSAGVFTPPPEGPHQAVCVDIVDLGIVETDFETKPMVRVVWHTADLDPETGRPYVIQKRYNRSLNEKATLCKDLEAWRGRAFTEIEKQGFDLETTIGANCFLSVVHRVSNGKTFGNVGSIMPLPKGMTPLPITEGYVRHCDREQFVPDGTGDKSDDSIPF